MWYLVDISLCMLHVFIFIILVTFWPNLLLCRLSTMMGLKREKLWEGTDDNILCNSYLRNCHNRTDRIWWSWSKIGGPGIAANTLSLCSNVCKLKRGPKYVYVFDLMNLLYSMCCISAIADLLVQRPPVPTRETVCMWCSFICCLLHLFHSQNFAYLDRWNVEHKFDASKKKR